MIIYIAGPMSDHPDFNRPLFREVEADLQKYGNIVLTPAVLPDGMQHHQYMTICLAMVDVADAIILLNGWRASKGAVMEYERASLKGKMIVLDRDIDRIFKPRETLWSKQ